MENNMLAQLYGIDTWPREAQREGTCARFVVPSDAFEREGFHLAWRDALPGARRAYRSYYLHEEDAERRMMVDVVPAPTYEEAKEALLDGLAACAHIVPRASGPELGDVAFGGEAAQQFVRGNLVITVASCGTEDVDVRPFAEAPRQGGGEVLGGLAGR